jgi:hypothetical protein
MRRKTGPKPRKAPLMVPKAEDSPAGAAPEALTQGEAANRLGISAAWLRDLGTRREITRNDDGSYPWPRIREEFDARAERDANDGTDADVLRDEQIRWTREKADKAAMENELLRGNLVRVDDSVALLEATLFAMDASLRSAKRRHGPALARQLNIAPGEAMAIIEGVTEEVRAGLLQAIEQVAADERKAPAGEAA